MGLSLSGPHRCGAWPSVAGRRGKVHVRIADAFPAASAFHRFGNGETPYLFVFEAISAGKPLTLFLKLL